MSHNLGIDMDFFEEEGDHEIDVISPSERTAAFARGMAELQESPAGLAVQMSLLGDYRATRTIERGLLRMVSGESRVSGEMTVIMELILRNYRRARLGAESVNWHRSAQGNSIVGDYGDWHIALSPQTQARWAINLTLRDHGYSPAWPRWQPTLEVAKIKAVAYAEQVMSAPDFAEILRANSQSILDQHSCTK